MIKKELLNKKYLLGTWSVIPSSYTANIISKAGMDFQILDMEHGILNYETCQEMLFSIKSENKYTFIRVPAIKEEYILRALDLGVDGLVFPGIESQEQLNKIKEYCFYKPEGEKGFNPFVYTGNYGDIDNYFCQKKNKELCISIIIESKKALDNIDIFLNCDFIDIIYIGQYDLSVDLGVPGNINSKEILDILAKVAKKTREAKKSIGCMVHSVKEANEMIKLGFNFIVYGVDSNILYKQFTSFKKGVNNETL